MLEIVNNLSDLNLNNDLETLGLLSGADADYQAVFGARTRRQRTYK